jgi:hypothetical protein
VNAPFSYTMKQETECCYHLMAERLVCFALQLYDDEAPVNVEFSLEQEESLEAFDWALPRH